MAILVADFFCGCGGTSAGFRKAGMEIILGLDFDADSAATFKENLKPKKFFHEDITKVRLRDVAPFLMREPGDTLVLCGCAPCQPFSKIKTRRRKRDGRTGLLKEFGRFVRRFKPDYVVIENVPGMQSVDQTKGPLKGFLALLDNLEYKWKLEVVQCQYYGVPQKRRRLVVIATRHGEAPWPLKTHGPGTENPRLPTVWDKIAGLPAIGAGEKHPEVPNHETMSLSPKNQERISLTPVGGGRECWPPRLRLKCHDDHAGHSDVYGRLRKDSLSAALTTRCISLSNGRFGHPTQNRALSVREAACLQTFEMDFVFKGGITSASRQIGNAVPVSLAEQIGIAIVEHDRIRRAGL